MKDMCLIFRISQDVLKGLSRAERALAESLKITNLLPDDLSMILRARQMACTSALNIDVWVGRDALSDELSATAAAPTPFCLLEPSV